ncbi:MAG: VOC family protein [Nocardioides sp.]
MSLARWQDLCLDATDPERLAAFWAPVLGLRRDPAITHAVTLVGAEPTQRVWINSVDRPKRVKNRLHLDVYAESVDELVALGATVLAPAEDTGLSWTVMADPEGGEFCAFLRDPAELPAYRLHGIVIDAADPRALAAWWGDVFGVAPVVDETHDWHTLEHATPDPVLTLDFVPVPEPRVGPNRVHWDVTGDVEPLLSAGATRLWDMPDWTVLADPEGNEFCVFPSED